MDRFL